MRKINEGKIKREKLFLKLSVKEKLQVTDEEIEYFRQHPEEIDELTAPLNVHKFFLGIGIILGILLVGLSKILKYISVKEVYNGLLEEFILDIIFEIGVALIGAGVTAYLLGILMNNQQQNAKKWRKEIRKKIRNTDVTINKL